MTKNYNINYLGYFCQTLFRMRTALKIAFFFVLYSTYYPSIAQNANQQEKESLEKEFDGVAQEWHTLSRMIDNYEGLTEYCRSHEFKNQVITSIMKIHHFDSLIIDKLRAPSFVHDNVKEEKKTLESIEEFESKYRISSFIKHLQDECDARHDIEKNRKKTANEIGSESYSGQVYLVEIELYKYIHHIDKRLEHIEKHLHKIHIDDVNGP